MNKRTTGFEIVAALALFVALTTNAAAQVTEGQVEVLGLAGGMTDGGGATFGGGFHYAFAPNLLAVFEAGYLTGGSDFSGFGVDVDSHGLSLDGNVHYLFPSSNDRLTPYVLGGVGYVRASVSASGPGFNSDASASTTGLNLGAGARWQVGSNWGLRPELKVLIADNSSVRFAVAIYRQFRQ